MMRKGNKKRVIQSIRPNEELYTRAMVAQMAADQERGQGDDGRSGLGNAGRRRSTV